MLLRSEEQGNSWYSLCDEAHTPSKGNFHGLAINNKQVGEFVIGTDDGEVWWINNEAKRTPLADKLPAVLSTITV